MIEGHRRSPLPGRRLSVATGGDFLFVSEAEGQDEWPDAHQPALF